ncbi:MAG: heat shock protein HtpX [Hyphomicrobiaceae bacterium]|jgi:heat shock protein HtpX
MLAMANALKTVALLAALSAVLILIGNLVGGTQGMIVAFGFAVAMNIGSYWFSDSIVLRMYRAKECPPDHRLSRTVAKLTQRAGMPMPRVFLISNTAQNAFATGRNPTHAAVAATQGLLDLMNDEELEGVIGHELAHVQNRDILIQSVAATIGAAIMMLANMARMSAMFGRGRGGRGGSGSGGSNPLVIMATAMVAPLAAMVIQAAISRSREFEADRGGAEIAGSPLGLASALAKLEAGSQRVPMDANPATAHMFIIKPFSAASFSRLFSTHPPTEERIKRLTAIGFS